MEMATRTRKNRPHEEPRRTERDNENLHDLLAALTGKRAKRNNDDSGQNHTRDRGVDVLIEQAKSRSNYPREHAHSYTSKA
jgi:hypothetical protein